MNSRKCWPPTRTLCYPPCIVPKDGISGWPDYCGLPPVHTWDEPVKMQPFGWAGVRVMISYPEQQGWEGVQNQAQGLEVQPWSSAASVFVI